jgi:WD40 repeat protein
LEGHYGAITSLAYAPDGKSLASGGTNSTILIWDVMGRLRNAKRPKPLTAAELEARGQDLLGADAARAYEAIGDLVAAGDGAVTSLQSRLSPVPIPDAKVAKRASELVAALNNDAFAVRRQAALELEKLGNAAVPALREALAGNPTLETRRRIEQILAGLDGKEAPFHLRKSRALEALELIATPAARNLLQALAEGEPSAPLTQEARAAQRRLEQR